MSKKFDKEYLTFLRDSTPDVWDNIENNLSENPKREMPKKKKQSIFKKITYFALPIAATLVIAILLPFWLDLSQREKDEVKSVFDEAEMTEETINESGEVSEKDEVRETMDNVDEEYVADQDIYEGYGLIGESAKDALYTECVPEEEISNVMVQFECTIRILSKKDNSKVDNAIENPIDSEIYLVTIIWNAEGLLSEGSNVLLFVDATKFVLHEMEEYHVIMEADEDGYLLCDVLE